jgi:spermidine synthase
VPKSNNSTRIYFGVCLCFLLSGFAALLYQTAWMRQFSTVFGTSELAVATVLSAYMGGLALGAALAGRFIGRVSRPVLTYGFLEAAIAVSALMVPLLLAAANWAYVTLLGGQAEPPDASGLGQSVFYFVVTFIVLAIPTACMGATLPLLTRYAVKSDSQIGSRIGTLYAINTVGAVIGTVVAAFLLLPSLGLMGTVWSGVAVNLLVFVLAVLIARYAAVEASGDVAETPKTDLGDELDVVETSVPMWRSHTIILPIMLLSGTTSFVYEVLWTRLLSHILGGSITAFATMLASFLSGIAIGSAIASRIATTAEHSIRVFVFVQAGIAFTSMAIYHWLYLAIPAENGLQGNVGIAIAILLPATLFIGATFPLAVRIYTSNFAGAARSSARVYSWNTVGAIFGAAFAGFFLIPALKYEGAIQVAALTNVLLGLAAALLVTRQRSWFAGSMAVIFVALLFIYRPGPPEQILRVSPIEDRTDGEILYYDVGRSSTVLMTRENGTIGLRNNGLPEAGTEFRGSPPSRFTQTMLTALPAVIRPDAKSMLIVGFGGGNAINGVPQSVDEIDVIELEPKVIEANGLIGDLRSRDPLADPRVSIYINDARSALSLTSKTYDAIISQPSHPWTAGASHLYTREYMALAANHLSDDGVFLQWMGAQYLSEKLLRELCATMLDVFEHVKVYQLFPEVLFLVGSQQPMNTEMELAATGRPVIDDPVFFYHMGLASTEDLLAGLVLDTDGARAFSNGAALITDNFNRMATESVTATDSEDRLDVVALGKLLQPWVPVLDPDSWVHRDMSNANFAYISNRFEEMQLRLFSVELAATLEQTGNPQSLLLTGIGLQKQGDLEEGQKVLARAVAESRQSNQAIYAMLEPWLGPMVQGKAPEHIVKLAEELTGPAAAVVSGRAAVVRRDWQAVAALDPLFAQSRPTDLWFVESTRLMVEWRNNLARLQNRSDLAAQAWQIIDIAIAVRPVADLYAMRVSAAYFADRPEEVLETARRMTFILESELESIEKRSDAATIGLLELRKRQIGAILAAVNDVANRHDLSSQSVAEVVTKLGELQELAAGLSKG